MFKGLYFEIKKEFIIEKKLIAKQIFRKKLRNKIDFIKSFSAKI
jgi:hypothetical protein